MVCDSTREAATSRKRWIKLASEDAADVPAITWIGRNSNIICVAFKRSEVCHNHIAHEVFHIVSSVMSIVGENYDHSDHESFSYLCGYVTELIYKDMKQWGIKVK